MKKYKVLTPIIYGGTVKNIGTVLENLTSEEEKRMLERKLIEECEEVGEVLTDLIPKDQTGDIPEKDDEPTIEDIEIVKYSETELKTFEKSKLLDIAKEMELNVPANIGIDKIIVKILEEYEAIEKENQSNEDRE